MFVTEDPPPLLEHFLLHYRRLVELTLVSERSREVIHRRDRGRMFVTEDPPPLLQYFFLHRRRLVELTLVFKRGREVVHRRDRGRMFLTIKVFESFEYE